MKKNKHTEKKKKKKTKKKEKKKKKNNEKQKQEKKESGELNFYTQQRVLYIESCKIWYYLLSNGSINT